ncbi:MAG: hypothetical protein IJJ85_05835 [Clostridia bacterium]|nr:hypothetical protein [Clostridia bacterium]
MYRLYSSGCLLFASGAGAGRNSAVAPKLRTEVNKADVLTFTVPAGAPEGCLTPMLGRVEAYDGETRIFYGRIRSVSKDFYNRVSVTAEGELAFLRDSVVRPYRFERRELTTAAARTGAVRDYVEMLLAAHNAQVDADRRFYPGTLDVSAPDTFFVRDSGIYPDTLTELTTKLLDELKGYLFLRTVTENGETRRYLDYLSAAPVSEALPTVTFGKNLLDLTSAANADALFTFLVPVGDTPEGEEDAEPVTLADDPTLNGGSDAMEVSPAMTALYGAIYKSVRFEGIMRPDTLYARAAAYIAQNALPADALTVRAVDLRRMGGTGAPMQVGGSVRVKSPPHGLDAVFLCTRAETDLSSPDRSSYTFGALKERLTDRRAALRRQEADERRKLGASIAAIQNNFVDQTAFEAYRAEVDARFEALNEEEEENA